jgi:hypothetical protein
MNPDLYSERFAALRAFFPSAREFSFDCFSVNSTVQALTGCLEAFPRHNIVIAPINTKLSTLGAAFFALKNESVQICYAQALLYNVRGYSRQSDYCYVLTPEHADVYSSRDHEQVSAL